MTTESHKQLCKKKNEDLFHWFFYHRVYTQFKGSFWTNHQTAKRVYSWDDYKALDEFVKVAQFSQRDGSEVMARYLDDPSAFVYLDPPYFQSWNGHYYSNEKKVDSEGFVIDFTMVWMDILQLLDSVTPCVLVTNYVTILHQLLKNHFYLKYGKKYQLHSRKTQHAVYANI